MRMRRLAWAVLLVFGLTLVDSIDFLSEKEYDTEFEDELNAIQDLEDFNNANDAASLNLDTSDREEEDAIDQFLRSEEEEDGDIFEDDDEEEELDHVEENLLEQFYEDVTRRSLKTRVTNMLHHVRNKYSLKKPDYKNGTCDTFRGRSRTSHNCSTEMTVLGSVMVCRVKCRSGYHLKRLTPHYELCGAPTKWRWTYQLKGKSKAGESCVKGSAKKKLPTSCTDPYCVATAAYYINKIDYSVNPCHDFFEYSCGRWLKETPYPPASKGRLMTYSILRKRVKKDMAKLLQKPLNNTDISSVKKAKLLYQSCMDTALINKLDSKPLLDFLRGELTWPVISPYWSEYDFDLESTIAALRGKYHNNILFNVKVGKSFDGYTLQTWKGKTALPYLYYIEPRYANRKAAYFSLMKDTAVMLGADKTTAYYDMRDVLDFEMQISLLKIVDKDYWTEKTISQMYDDIPGIDWLRMFKQMINSAPINEQTVVQVWNVNYLRDLIRFIRDTDKRTVQNYMVWRIVKHRIRNLSRRFQLRYLDYDHSMYGTKALHKRWYYCSLYTIFSMKGPTGKMFVDSYFSPAKKATAEEMFNNIRNAFIYLLDAEVDWMDKKTKDYAKEKAKFIEPYIGYNPHIYENSTYLDNLWKQYVAKKNDYFGNVVHALTQISQNEFKKLTETIKILPRGQSTTRPTMVNAFYSPSHNTITLPAGEMQYPFYWGDKFPKMFQYGAIGTILGHEITHGFDNHGALRDKYGRARNWWTEKSLLQFHKRTQCMATQYSNYFWKAAGTYLNGQRSLGENIADNGGIRESYQGYKFWLKSQNLTGESIEPATGLTNDQMFFVGFANVRCAKYTHKAAEHYAVRSVHSPGRFRVIGSLQNFDKFSEAFHCPKNSYMNPKKKCIIW